MGQNISVFLIDAENTVDIMSEAEPGWNPTRPLTNYPASKEQGVMAFNTVFGKRSLVKRYGSLNNNWRGGRVVASSGYILIRVGTDHHLADVRGYAYEHRVVAESKIGRRLRAGEQVHHIDGDKLNNAPDNLEVQRDIRAHRYHHRKDQSKRRKPNECNCIIQCECGCGTAIHKYDANDRPRRYVSGHNIQPKGKR